MAHRTLLLFLALAPLVADAQPHDHPPSDLSTPPALTTDEVGGLRATPGMASATAPHGPMSRDGSGTAWLPDASPMEAVHASAGAWALMLHGAAFPRYTAQDAFDSGTRGDASLGAPNWVMGMAQRSAGLGRLTVRAMISADPLTEGGDGYPLLLQSGETFEGERLVDRQHPHDLVDELAVMYTAPVSDRVGVFGYAAYPGEPALGPPAFMHRPSARFLADAPISHHWQDATHIAWGVATAGVVLGPVKLDASLFTGAEPDEERIEPDRPRLDSYSARLSVNPTDRWALQVSRGFLREPEALEPGVDQRRTTASMLYSQPFRGGDLSAAIIWGMNQSAGHDEAASEDEHHGTTHAVLGEATLTLGRQAFFGRAEWTQKPPAELALDDLGEDALALGLLTLGSAREVAQVGPLAATLGAQATLYRIPDTIQALYGKQPVSLQVFLRLTPARMAHGMGHGAMDQDNMNHDGMH